MNTHGVSPVVINLHFIRYFFFYFLVIFLSLFFLPVSPFWFGFYSELLLFIFFMILILLFHVPHI